MNNKISKLPICVTFIFGLLIPNLSQAQSPEHSGEREELQQVEIRTGHDHMNNKHKFMLDRKEISSGWTTFNLVNSTAFEHFVVFFKVPDAAIDEADQKGITVLDHWRSSVTVPFQETFTPYIEGKVDYDGFVENLVPGT